MYTSEHGDIWLNKDRKEFQYSLDGITYSLHPNQWYVAGEDLAIDKAVSIADSAWALVKTGNATNAGKVFLTDSASVDKTVGFVLKAATAGNPVEIISQGLFKFSTAKFLTSDIGLTAYVIPSLDGDMTTDRSLASSASNQLIECGIVKSVDELFIDFEGDSRGAANLSQVQMLAAENLVNTGVPFLVAELSAGTVVKADKLKSNNRYQVVGWAVGATVGWNGTIPSGESVVIQKLGVVLNTGFAFTALGEPVYMDSTGGYTQNRGSLNSYTDVYCQVGTAQTATSVYVKVEPYNYTWDAYPVGSIVQQFGATPDAGYFACAGTTNLNCVGTTTNPTGQPVGTYDTASLYQEIKSTFGGTVRWTVTGSCSAGVTYYINGVAYTTVGTTATAVAAEIAAKTQTGYTFSSGGAGIFQIVHTGSYAVPTFVPPAGLTFTVTGGTYSLSNLNAGSPKYQIKYINLYRADPMNAPTFRISTDYTAWPTIPVGYTGTPGSYIDIPTNSLGTDVPIEDMFCEIYATKAGAVRKVVSSPVIYTLIAPTTYSKYGYQITKSSANNVRVEFAPNGLAYMDIATGLYVALDATWNYKINLYKSERYNKFFDTTADSRLNQMWNLGLADTSVAYNVQVTGKLDRSTTNPNVTHTTRLNYDGDFYVGKLLAFSNSTISRTYSGATTADETMLQSSGTFAIADTGIKTSIKALSTATHTTGSLANLSSIIAHAVINGTGGTTASLRNILSNLTVTAGTITTGAHVHIANATGAGTLSVQYGLYIENLSKGATNYSIYTGTAPSVLGGTLEVSSTLSTQSTSFNLLNTTATTIDFAGGASVALNMGNASGVTTIRGTAINLGTAPTDSIILKGDMYIRADDGIANNFYFDQATGNLTITGNGTFSGGVLNIGTDVNLYRSAAHLLKTDDSLQVVGDITTSSGVVNFNDCSIYRSVAGVLRTDNNMVITGTAGLQIASGAPVKTAGYLYSGSTNPSTVSGSRLNYDGDFYAYRLYSVDSLNSVSGLLNLGADVNLYRSAANVIKTDDTMVVAGTLSVLGTATTAGNFNASATAPTGTTRLNYEGYFYATKVYGAIWNDIVDYVTVEEDVKIECGKAYIFDGVKHRVSSCYAEQGCIGIASDTFGFAVGIVDGVKQLPTAVSGYVLAYTKVYKSGTALTNGKDGSLVKAKFFTKIFYPERIIATFYKPQHEQVWNKVAVDGRHWVRVK